MVFNEDILFTHNGKTGGMSCSKYLLHNIKKPVFNCHFEAAKETQILGIEGVVPLTDIGRHCTLEQALDFIYQFNGKRWEDFKKIVVVIRHPYSLEYSFYKYLQLPKARVRRPPEILELADGDFKTFVEKAGYHGGPAKSQEVFFTLNGQVPPNVEIIRFEHLSKDFPAAVSKFFENEEVPFPHFNRNVNKTPIPEELLSDEVKQIIYRKHKYLFDNNYYSTAF